VRNVTFAVATAVALSIPSDTNIKKLERKNINAMRLQLQQGLHTHFWGKPFAYVEPRWVTKADIYAGLGEMWTAVDLNMTQEPFPGSAMKELHSAIIRMSAWVTKAAPLAGGIYTAHQEYAKSARIDLEQVGGLNFR
ncbi:MAG: hypothetical protein ABIY47_15465, partial [Opitutaceae bacterium]